MREEQPLSQLEQIEKYIQKQFEIDNARLTRMEENGSPDGEYYYSTLARVEMLEDIISEIDHIKNNTKC